MSLFPLTSRIDALREYFSRMDIEMLDLILDDAGTYARVNKHTFMQRLGEAFNLFKACGDTRLNIYRGECGSCHRGCRGYTLCGNVSGHYLDLIIKEEDGKITDIYHCGELVNYKDFEKNTPLTLGYSCLDDTNFTPDADYVLLVQKCRQACTAFSELNGIPVMVKTIEQWLATYRPLYEDCIPYCMYAEHAPFFELYHTLKHLMQMHGNRDAYMNAYLGMKHLVTNPDCTENELLAWLLNNESLGRSDFGQISSLFEDTHFCNGKVLLYKDPAIYLDESEFRIFFDFELLFDRLYYPLLKQYSVFSPSETEAMEPYSDEHRMAMSLTYNIRQRELWLWPAGKNQKK